MEKDTSYEINAKNLADIADKARKVTTTKLESEIDTYWPDLLSMLNEAARKGKNSFNFEGRMFYNWNFEHNPIIVSRLKRLNFIVLDTDDYELEIRW